ncbi:NXPE family member 3-like [Scomber japonicus]|uniref:NXPE family member 3-like n=1 Tax=Scomber japonicus TaxID=13676 RepID=UPI0023058F5D|nr:NXPE family member 3-like [Scomber japonicus]
MVSFYCPNYAAIFVFLAVFVFFYVLFNTDVLEFQHKGSLTVPVPRRHLTYRFCSFEPLSPEDALEERLLLDSIAWPETPSLPAPLSLEQTTDPAHSRFTVLPERGGQQWHVGDQLEVMIKMYDFRGRPKKSGGDVLFARLHNRSLGAGVAGKVLDHLNGSYSAVFSLLWEGSAQVEVTLVHPSEAVTVLKRIDREQPDRIRFQSGFHSGSVSETTICNVCLRPTAQSQCNFTDLTTGEPWFCYKPKNLSCDTRITNYLNGYKGKLEVNEKKLFKSGINMKVSIRVSGSSSVTVLPSFSDQPEVKSNIVQSGPVGYYYKDVWQSISGPTVRQFNSPSVINHCLKGKVVHLYGDSTVRQWFEYLKKSLPDLKQFNLHSSVRVGPFMALNYADNILVTYRFHGPPVGMSASVPTIELHYIANEVDRLVGGANTIVVFGIWTHLSSFPTELYIRRLQNIRRAVVRLLDRAPDTLVIIRTGNPKTVTPVTVLFNSDWYSLQRDKVLRAMFKGLNVHLVDAWEMVLAHHLPHNIHPQPPIIKNMINVVLSHICPQKSS